MSKTIKISIDHNRFSSSLPKNIPPFLKNLSTLLSTLHPANPITSISSPRRDSSPECNFPKVGNFPSESELSRSPLNRRNPTDVSKRQWQHCSGRRLTMLQVRGKVRVRPGRKRRGAIRRSLTETRRDADRSARNRSRGGVYFRCGRVGGYGWGDNKARQLAINGFTAIRGSLGFRLAATTFGKLLRPRVPRF